jgi:hypothetical protein
MKRWKSNPNRKSRSLEEHSTKEISKTLSWKDLLLYCKCSRLERLKNLLTNK